MTSQSRREDMSPRLLRVAERAKRDPKGAILSLASLIDEPALERAYNRIRKKAAVGVDGVSKEQYGQNLRENLRDLNARIRAKRYRHQAIRRVHIPKERGKTRPIGVSTIEDKVVQNALREVLEVIYEPVFHDSSYGFRPRRGAHDALRSLNRMLFEREVNWIIEADIQSYLDASSYCTLICCEAVEEARHRVGELDFQAFSSSLPDVDSLEVATLYTLQDGLTADAQSERGFEHRDVAGWRVVNETCAQLIGDANAPRSAGRELLASDEAVVEPTVHRGRRDAENVCSAIDVDDLALLLRVGRLETRDLPVRAQAADAAGCEAQAFRAGLALSI